MHHTASAPWKEFSRSHAADSTVSDEVSAVRCGRTLRIDQIMNTNRSRRSAGTHVYNPHLLDNRWTSSSVREAGALVPSPPSLGEGSHGWVPVDTHSTPVLTSVRRLWVAYLVYEPNTQQEHAQLAQIKIKREKRRIFKNKKRDTQKRRWRKTDKDT